MDDYIIKKIDSQIEYINKKLTNTTSCTLEINKVSTSIVKNILENKFNNGVDMNTVICMFDNLFLSTAKSKHNGLFHLSVHVTKWVKNLEKINVDSSQGYVYFSDILSNIKVIIKLPQSSRDYNEMIREYFIGITSINKLRYIVPNFVYTFGAFICPMDNGVLCNGTSDSGTLPFVIFENIPGENMQKMLQKNKLTFSQYLGMFIQILLALEVAQREINFTHFDFHTANLMCRTIKDTYKYKVPLDNIVYEISANEYLPVIIDFGLSTVKQDDVVLGSYTFPKHGMMNFILPGVDMFKFLYYSCTFSNNNLQRQILNLMSFYGKDDPYKFLIGGDNALDKANKEYAKKCSFSRVTPYTPLEFLNWILEQPEYNSIVSMYIKKIDRNVYIPLSFPTYEFKFNIEQVLYLIQNGITSYIQSNYFIYVLNRYDTKIMSNKLVNKLISNVTKYKDQLIEADYKILMEYRNLSIPNIIKIQDDSKRILNIKINSKKLKTERKQVFKLIERYLENISFFTEILPYLQFLYIIKEIKLEKVYTKFLSSFISSQQYKMYSNYHISITKTHRWCNSLIDSFE